MSMIGNVARISVKQLEDLRLNPEHITRVIYPDIEPEPPAQPGFLARLLGRKPEPVRPLAPVESVAAGDAIDLDKAWHCLHYLLAGQAWEGDFPQGFLVTCGEEVGMEDVGYGPARSFTPAETEEIAAHLDSLDEAKLRAAFDPAAMLKADIYGVGGPNPLTDEEWSYYLEAFRNLRSFVRETAARKMALLVYIN